MLRSCVTAMQKKSKGVIMAYYNTTKKSLAAALKSLLIDSSFEKVSVGEICTECGINRKSFYYHFKDKYELVVWIFHQEFQSIFNIKENTSSFITRLAEYFYENRGFYKRILPIEGQNNFREYLSEYSLYAFTEAAKTRMDASLINLSCLKLYADFLSYSIYRWICASDVKPSGEFTTEIKKGLLYGSDLAKLIL